MEDLDSFEPNDRDVRLEMHQQAVAQAVQAGVLDVDEQRTRARYSDGQVLGAEGFRRDHALFGQRQRDLGHIVERGVVAGLHVHQALLLDENDQPTDQPDPTKLMIDAGHGVTRAGQTIVLRETITIDLTELPIFQQLDAVFGLDRRPRPPIRTQSGVFAVALRPVEFTANPVAPYPTSITGERRLEDGDVIEASVVTLVPLQTESSLDGVDAGPASLARRVFAAALDPLPLDDALPLAVVALERGQIAWLDVDLARREATADPEQGFGAGHWGDLDAHMRHFAARMAAIIERRTDAGTGLRFAASDYFEVLPPAGTIPAEAVSVSGDRIVQWFFPANVEADLVLVPEDELAQLLDEAMLLGPYQLAHGAKAGEASPMMLVLPIAREQFAGTAHAFGGVLRQPIGPRLGSYAHRRPVDALLRRFQRPASLNAGATAAELVPWETALADAVSKHTPLWFFRQRRRAQTAFALARYGPIPIEQRPSGTLSDVIHDRIDAADELTRFDQLLAEAGTEALEQLEALFSLAVFGASPLFINGVMAELSARTRRRLLDPGLVTAGGTSISLAGVPAGAPAGLRVRALSVDEVDTVAKRYQTAGLGDGMAALAALQPDLGKREVRLVIAQSLRLPELDARALDTEASERATLASKLLAAAFANDVNGIRDLVGYIRAEPNVSVPLRRDGVKSSGFEHAKAVGQAGLFAALYRTADLTGQLALDEMLTTGPTHYARQPLVVGLALMTLLRKAWAVRFNGPQDVWLLIEQLYRWPFTPTVELALPTLAARTEILLSDSNPTLVQTLQQVSGAAVDLEARNAEVGLPAGTLAKASEELEAHGFPPVGLPATDAYRILGCAISDWSGFISTGSLVLAKLGASEFTNYVGELADAVLAADLPKIRAIEQAWFDKLNV
jgi:hypothetical protein